MADRQLNSDLENRISILGPSSSKVLSAKTALLGWAIFLFSERNDGKD